MIRTRRVMNKDQNSKVLDRARTRYFAGHIDTCKGATAIIDTTGCSQLHKETMRAIKLGLLPNVNRLFLMRPTEGYAI